VVNGLLTYGPLPLSVLDPDEERDELLSDELEERERDEDDPDELDREELELPLDRLPE
jgi:hypothetical protein